MKTLRILVAITLFAASVGATASSGRVYVVMSPRLEQTEMARLYREHLQFICERAPSGLKIRYLDGERQTTITDLVVPDIANPRGRARKIESSLRMIQGWIRHSLARKESKDSRINLPGVLDQLTLDLDVEKESVVLLAGSPLYINETEPSFSFLGEAHGKTLPRVPNDALLAVERRDSPFGVVGLEDRLEKVRFLWWVPNESVFRTDLYRTMNRRFWTLFLSKQSGRLVAFTPDLSEAHRLLLRSDLVSFKAEIDLSNDRLVMRSEVRKVGSVVQTNSVERADLMKLKKLEKFSQVIAVDRTQSMGDNFAQVAAKISLLPATEWYGLWTYGDHHDPSPASLFREGNDPSVMAKALREIGLTGGGDNPECLEDALFSIVRELLNREVTSANVTIFTDAPSHTPEECPHAYDYRAEFAKLIEMGHTVTVVSCDPQMPTDWIPQGVRVEMLSE